ncbi:5281_t:CDS:2 [Ambispora gerdemannii]|uniref:5281_t:CDS:1 n=1 Tax=Ambispora gerdemannii TaxID=144530 RepID=A0A9N8W232_9GLOM|nr:5281_t:CDS:2 [Ambispora gerdemannii]
MDSLKEVVISPQLIERSSSQPIKTAPEKGNKNSDREGISKFDSVKSGTIIKIETDQNGKSAITLKKEKDPLFDSTPLKFDSRIYIGYHRIKTTPTSHTTDSLEHHDLGSFETRGDINWSVAVFDTTESTWIAFSFYDFSNIKDKRELAIYKNDNFPKNVWRNLNSTFGRRKNTLLSDKSVLFLVYDHQSREIVQSNCISNTGNGIIKFLNDEELIILRRNNFRIIRYKNNLHLSKGITNFFESTKKRINFESRINTDHSYPPPMNKFAEYSKSTKDVVEHKLTNFVKGELDKLFNINKSLAKVQEKKHNDTTNKELTVQNSEEYFRDKNKKKEILPVFAVATNKEKQQYLAASLGTLKFEENQGTAELKRIANFHHMELTKHPSNINYYKLEYKKEYKYKIKDLEFFVKKNSIFYTNYKKDSLVELFYQNPYINQKKQNHAVNQQNNKVKDGNEKELIIDGNEMKVIIGGKKEPITIIDGNEMKIIIDGNEKEIDNNEKEIKINGKQLRVKLIIEKEINNKMKIDGNGRETITVIDDNKMREINGNENEINSNKVIGKVKIKIIIDGNKREIDRNEEEIDGNEEEIDGNKEEINDNEEKIDGNEIDNDEKDKKIKIIIEDKIVRIFKEDQNKKKGYSLVNIWSIPTAFSKYLTDPIISAFEYVKQNQSVKLTLNSRYDKNKLGFKHDIIPIKPRATSIVGMCSALKLINEQKDAYEKNQEVQKETNKGKSYEKLIRSIKIIASNIIKEAIEDLGNFRILDARFRIVTTMIKADFQDQVIHYILNKPEDRLHIPRQAVHDKPKEPSYNFVFQNWADYDNEHHPRALSIAINQDQHETVEKLLDYYSTLAKENLSWMETVTQALPELIIKFPKSVIQLMKKEVFHSQEIHLDKSWESYRPNNNPDNFQSFHIKFNLFDPYRQQEYKKSFKDKKNHISRYRKTNMGYFQVPLPGLIESGSSKERIKDAVIDITWNFFLNLVLLERTRHNESPFTRLIIHDKTGEIYDNPSIEAIVDFQWRHYARFIIILEFLFYIAYAISFIWLSYAHLNKIVYSQPVGPVFIPAVAIMCGFAYNLLVRKIKEMRYLTKQQILLIVLYAFDLAGLTLPLIGCAMMLSVHLRYTELLPESDTDIRKESPYCQRHHLQCQSQVIYYSLAGLLLWVVFVRTGILPGSPTFSGSFTTENPNNGTTQILENNVTYPNFTIQQNLDWADRSDNYYYFWDKSVQAVYFWISGRWDQVTNWNFWPVDLVTVIASIFLATLLQNLLISLMGDVLKESTLEKRAVSQIRAQLLIKHTYSLSHQRNVYYAIPTEKWRNLTNETAEKKLERIEKLAEIEKNELRARFDSLEKKLDNFFKDLNSQST